MLLVPVRFIGVAFANPPFTAAARTFRHARILAHGVATSEPLAASARRSNVLPAPLGRIVSPSGLVATVRRRREARSEFVDRVGAIERCEAVVKQAQRVVECFHLSVMAREPERVRAKHTPICAGADLHVGS